MSRDGSIASLGEMAPQEEWYAKHSGRAHGGELFQAHGRSLDKQLQNLEKERVALRNTMDSNSVWEPTEHPHDHDLLAEHAMRECLAHAMLLLVHMLVPDKVRRHAVCFWLPHCANNLLA